MLNRIGLEIRKIRPSDERINTVLYRLHRKHSIETIFDVGANTGQSVAHYKRLLPNSKIYSFEPVSSAYAELEKTAIQYKDIRTFKTAIGQHDTRAEIKLNQKSQTNSLLETSNSIPKIKLGNGRMLDEEQKTISTEIITIRRLDSIIQDMPIESIDLLKIDTQGYERDVLLGCGSMLSPEKIRLIFLEVLFIPLYEGQTKFSEILSTLDKTGYKFYGFFDGHGDQSRGWYWTNALFVANQ